MRRWVWPIADANRALKAAIHGSVAKATTATLGYGLLRPGTSWGSYRLQRSAFISEICSRWTGTSSGASIDKRDERVKSGAAKLAWQAQFFLIGGWTGFLRDRGTVCQPLTSASGVIPLVLLLLANTAPEPVRAPHQSLRKATHVWMQENWSSSWRAKSHCSHRGVHPQCALMPKAPAKAPNFD